MVQWGALVMMAFGVLSKFGGLEGGAIITILSRLTIFTILTTLITLAPRLPIPHHPRPDRRRHLLRHVRHDHRRRPLKPPVRRPQLHQEPLCSWIFALFRHGKVTPARAPLHVDQVLPQWMKKQEELALTGSLEFDQILKVNLNFA